MNPKFAFLTSTRFWAMIIAAVAIYLQTKGWIGDAEMMLIATIASGFTVIGTVDRLGDKNVEASEAMIYNAPR
jgi:hypothetical protein